ncbi:hypothetical protein [uncultured Draconibacterium sp.]|uniref:hypothetical protein n=1 Tax=uncultured Draconibacterium sp. TaxID=1573823 RepID=UPI002AA8E1E2|nr:hypothetical protein [uncultured Draconibacterium sp.]
MKRIGLGLIVILLVCTMHTTQAQENSKQLWYCWEEEVHPEHINEYWEYSKELAQLCKDENSKFEFHAWTTGDFKYQYWHPINSLADIDELENEWSKILEKFGEEKTEKWVKTIKSNYSKTITEYSALSLIPEVNRIPMDSVNYMGFQEFYVIPGKQQEFRQIMKKAVDYMKSEGHNDMWRVASGELGYNGPVYIGWSYGKNQVEYLQYDNEFSKKYEKFFEDLNKDFVKVLRTVKSYDSWYLRDLSYSKN